jgi:ABC-type phosphate transport system ATPase subunit
MSSPSTTQDRGTNPFPGLRAFSTYDASDFFGRKNEIFELLSRLRTSRSVAVLGPSGSGKSSQQEFFLLSKAAISLRRMENGTS